MTKFENLVGRNKAGKAMLSLTPNAEVLQPTPAPTAKGYRVVAATSAGHVLAFPIGQLPEMERGKGNKIIDIPKAKLGTERVVDVAVVGPDQSLVVLSGARTMTLSYKDLESYVGQRGARGGLLPRGWQKVEGLVVE